MIKKLKTVQELKNSKFDSYIKDYMNSKEFDDYLQEYFNRCYIKENEDQRDTIHKNDEKIDKQLERLKEIEEQITFTKVQEDYIKRNKVVGVTDVGRTVLKTLDESNTKNSTGLTGYEEMSLKTYVKGKKNYDFIVERVKQGDTLREGMLNGSQDTYTVQLVQISQTFFHLFHF